MVGQGMGSGALILRKPHALHPACERYPCPTRAPKIALPTRTWVAPKAMAVS